MNLHTLFTFVPYAFFALALVTFVLRLNLSVRAQAIWTMVLLFCFSKFLGFAALGGHAFNPELPPAIIWTWDFLYSGAVILSALSLLTVWMRVRAKVWLLSFLSWGLAAFGLYNGIRAPTIHEVELKFADLPSSLDGYRIVQLSDLHCSSAATRWRTKAVVDATNALKPDLICLTGDLADGRVSSIAHHLEPLKELRARDGVYACTGNHEYYHDYRGWMTRFYAQTKNIRFLTNECVFPREGLALGGIPDKAAFEHCGIVSDRNWDETFDAATNGEFRVLMVHRPHEACRYVRECDVRLQLSGHTHGGIAPLLRTLVKLHNGGYVRGLYPAPGRTGDRYLYVNPGCGQWAGFPIRFFTDSEITLFTLR